MPKTGGRKAGSRNKINAEIRELAQKHGPAAIEALAAVLENGTSDSARVAAASVILDRGYGKAAQTITNNLKVDESAAFLSLLRALGNGSLAESVDTEQGPAVGLRHGRVAGHA